MNHPVRRNLDGFLEGRRFIRGCCRGLSGERSSGEPFGRIIHRGAVQEKSISARGILLKNTNLGVMISTAVFLLDRAPAAASVCTLGRDEALVQAWGNRSYRTA